MNGRLSFCGAVGRSMRVLAMVLVAGWTHGARGGDDFVSTTCLNLSPGGLPGVRVWCGVTRTSLPGLEGAALLVLPREGYVSTQSGADPKRRVWKFTVAAAGQGGAGKEFEVGLGEVLVLFDLETVIWVKADLSEISSADGEDTAKIERLVADALGGKAAR